MSEDEQSPAPVVDADEPEVATDSSVAPAVIDPNAPDPALPSGGDTVTGDAGNVSGSTTGAPPSTLENIDGAKSDTVSERNISEQTGDEDPAEAAYETDRLAAVANGDTSWPTWGFLGLIEQMEYIAKAG